MKDNKKMILVNLFGAPSAGKSTTGLNVTGFLKNKGISAELVDEYAKQLVYSRRHGEMLDINDQIYIFGKQNKKVSDKAKSGVPIVITDSPSILGSLYLDNSAEAKLLKYLMLMKFGNEDYHNINVFVNRVKKYVKVGRNQTEEESNELAIRTKALLPSFDFEIDGDKKGQYKFANILYKKIKQMDKEGLVNLC